MIKTLKISRFKSIRELSLDCRRINVFIGEPNTGKSNILESIGLLSLSRYAFPIDVHKQFLRYERTSNIFYDQDIAEPVRVSCNGISLEITFDGSSFSGRCASDDRSLGRLTADHNRFSSLTTGAFTEADPFKFYRFSVKETFDRREADFLLPPSGDNLLSLLLKNKELLNIVKLPFSSKGLMLGLRPHENKIELIKQVEDVIISYPYSLVSDTLQRLTFHVAAILSNKDSVITLEEPDAHAFPYYTKYLAELIARDNKGNQYFVSTHNPYFLLPIIEKAPREDISVNITYMKNYETRVKTLSEKELEESLELDIFANLDRFLERA